LIKFIKGLTVIVEESEEVLQISDNLQKKLSYLDPSQPELNKALIELKNKIDYKR
jgi:hypothetical protein